MDKKSILKDLSASDLRDELLGRLREQLRRNEEESESLRQQIQQLVPGGARMIDGSAARRFKSRTLVKNDQPLREVIVHVLREAGEPMRVKDVIDRVKQAGYQTKASNFAGIVNISLSQNDELFEKVGRGVYKLRDGVPVAEPVPAL